MENENLDFSPNLSNAVISIKFFLILDNTGSRIYCSYYINNEKDQELNSLENQKIFEKKLCEQTLKENVNRVELDIINFENYNILCKVNGEVNIFIGIKEDDNELLLEKLYDAFEIQLFDIVNENFTREKIFKNYDKLVILVDEIVYGGLILNLDRESLNDRIFEEKVKYDIGNNDNKNKKEEKKGNFFTNLFGF